MTCVPTPEWLEARKRRETAETVSGSDDVAIGLAHTLIAIGPPSHSLSGNGPSYKSQRQRCRDIVANPNHQHTSCPNMPKKFTIKTHHGKYICAEPSHTVVGNRDSADAWEHWEVIKLGGGKVYLKSAHGKYLSAETNGTVVANRDTPKEWETFHVEKLGHKKVHFKTHHGKYLCVEPSGKIIADRASPKEWETFEFRKVGHCC